MAKFTTTILNQNIYFISVLLEQIIVNFLSDIKAQLCLIHLAMKLSKMHPIIYLQRIKGTIDLKLLTQIIIM